MPSTVIVILPVEAFTDPFAEGSHYNIGSVGTHTLPRQEVSRKKAQANTVSVTKTILRRKPRLMAPVTQKLPEIPELREVSKLPELRGPNIYPLVNSSIKKLFSYPTQSYKIAGRLEHFLANWRKITSDQKMLQTVSGYKVELFETPHQIKPPQAHKFSTPEKALTEKEIKELEEKGAIKQVSPVPRSILKQLVSCKEKGRGNHPAINLKNLNGFVDYQHFKMEDISTLKDLIQPNNWMIKLDLKGAYFCVPIHKDHQKYFRFQWINSIKEFSCLPFGYGPAPRRFTKLFRPVLALLWKMGMRLVIYIDDIIILNQSRMALLQDTDTVIFSLQCVGFVINWTKSQLEPTQSLECLGFLVNSVLMTLALPEQKVENIVRKCHSVLNS